jgi:HemY protein
VMEAVKLAPTLVPAAVLAAKYQSEAHQIRRAMRIVEAAWLKHPHPDLADAYAHVKLGDSARQRLVRVETLAAKAPGHLEGALAVARAAIDASEFARAREALAPFTSAPTQRVAMLMAEIERTEHGDTGKARAWTLRAVRALHDPVWTADGYVSERWRPVSPVSGRLDAFQWQMPLAALPSDQSGAIEASRFDEAMLAPPSPRRGEISGKNSVEPPRAEETSGEAAGELELPPAAQDNSPAKPAAAEGTPAPAPSPPPTEAVPAAAPPLFRARQDIPTQDLLNQDLPKQDLPKQDLPKQDLPKQDLPKLAGKPALAIPAVIPIVRAPDDPGIDDEPESAEFAEQIAPVQGQAGGWRGFLSRWGG